MVAIRSDRASLVTVNSSRVPCSSPISNTAQSCIKPARPATEQGGRGTEDGEIPAIAGQHGSVLLKQLTDFRHDQRWNERMQNFTDRHHLSGAQDLTDVAAYVASLPRFPPTAKGIGDGSALGERREPVLSEVRAVPRPARPGRSACGTGRAWPGSTTRYLLRQLQETAANKRPGMDRAHVDMLKGISPEYARRGRLSLARQPGPELD